MAIIHRWAGIPGVVIFYFLLAALSFWLLSRLAEPYDDPWLTIFLCLHRLGFGVDHLLARPHIFTWFFGTLTLYICQLEGRWLFVLPPITALWANIHGGFVLGIVLQGLFLAGRVLERGKLIFVQHELKSFLREQKTPLLVFLLTVLASGLTPFGYELLSFPFRVSAGIFSSYISEWTAPNMQYFWPFRLYILLSCLSFFFGARESAGKTAFPFFFS